VEADKIDKAVDFCGWKWWRWHRLDASDRRLEELTINFCPQHSEAAGHVLSPALELWKAANR